MMLVKAATHAGAVQNILRAGIKALKGVDPDRQRRRLRQYVAMVDSAVKKLAEEKSKLMRPLPKDSSPCSNVGNALILRENEPALQNLLAFDEMLGLAILQHPVPLPGATKFDATVFTPRPMTDEDATALQHWMQHFALRGIGRATVTDAMVKVAKDGAFHPVRHYLDTLGWDNQPRVHRWLCDYLDTEDSEYTREVGLRFIVSMVARIYRPG